MRPPMDGERPTHRNERGSRSVQTRLLGFLRADRKHVIVILVILVRCDGRRRIGRRLDLGLCRRSDSPALPRRFLLQLPTVVDPAVVVWIVVGRRDALVALDGRNVEWMGCGSCRGHVLRQVERRF